MSPIQTITHLRSGTMFSWEILGLNFVGVPTGKRSIRPHHTHLNIKDAKEHGWYDKLKNTGKPTIYIIRDGRDVLASQFHFLKSLKTDFQGFLRGEGSMPGPKDYPGNPFPSIQRRIRENPVRAWIDHFMWIGEHWVSSSFKYEWIRENQEEFVLLLKEKYGLVMLYDKPQTVTKLVGIKPRKGITGDWKNHFTIEDLEYFWDIAGPVMEMLGYEK